jgi:hypothetical protein
MHTHSIVSHRTKRGMVMVEWLGDTAQFDPEDARRFAHVILRECDNAETDAFVYEFVTGLEVTDEAAWAMISGLRTHRARLEQAAGLRPTGQPVPDDDAR